MALADGNWALEGFFADAKASLEDRYRSSYALRIVDASSSVHSSSPAENTASSLAILLQKRKKRGDQWDMFFETASADMDVDPLQWWAANHAAYPTLALLARDMLAVPGSFASSSIVYLG
jgi:hypothetical protein